MIFHLDNSFQLDSNFMAVGKWCNIADISDLNMRDNTKSGTVLVYTLFRT